VKRQPPVPVPGGTKRAGAALRLLVLADEGLFRDGICAILRSIGGTAVRIPASAEAALEAIERKAPHLVVVDLESALARETGLLRRLTFRAGEMGILALTSSAELVLRSRAFRQGALGVVPKRSRAESLLDAVARLRDGRLRLERTEIAPVLDRLLDGERSRSSDRFDHLTRREREVVALVCQGLSNPELAKRLRISEATVRHHLTSIFAKLGVRDRVALVIAAFRRGRAPGAI
jgi:DNA-binding NarL/FixJ family response regulator